MRRLFGIVLVLAVLLGVAFWFLTRPEVVPDGAISGITPDPQRGAFVFAAAGCASCHAAPGAQGDATLRLAGGKPFVSAFGTFYAPNISPDREHGIGTWTTLDIVNAITRGVRKDGAHLYPALPYAAYRHMTLADAVSVAAYIATLPPDATPSKPHEVGFPFNVRRGIGLWKWVYLTPGFVVDPVPGTAEKGRYLAEALAHCGECHTPRDALGGLKTTEWLAGAPNPAGKGKIPDIRPGKLTWSDDDLMTFFTTGFTPQFDAAGGDMADVVKNLGTLPQDDLTSLIAYLKAVPAAP